jgi:hypothetical protein
MFSKTKSLFWQPHKIFRSIFLDPLPFPDAEDLLAGAREWQALENDRRWRMVEPENGRCRRMVGAGKWQALENGRRWGMVGAGEW